jgi:hypothetical protein
MLIQCHTKFDVGQAVTVQPKNQSSNKEIHEGTISEIIVTFHNKNQYLIEYRISPSGWENFTEYDITTVVSEIELIKMNDTTEIDQEINSLIEKIKVLKEKRKKMGSTKR